MNYRNEHKIQIDYSDLLALRQRLRAVLKADPNAVNGAYKIRSLYYDTPDDEALRDKINGTNKREKFRIRYYDNNPNYIRLEKKSRNRDLSSKDTAILTRSEVSKILNGDLEFMIDHEEELVREFYAKIKSKGLMPKALVEYKREPFVFGPGDVRVTLDTELRTSAFDISSKPEEFLNPESLTVPVSGNPMLLEVKWTGFLPDIIRDVTGLKGRTNSAFSKYAKCRGVN